MTSEEQSVADLAERGPGRPREPETDLRILDAALRLMAQGGYVRMSMDQVAAEAGVTKPTIYRRYPGKIQLALAAIVAFCDKDPPNYSGETRDDLMVQMQNFKHAMDRPHGMAMLGTMLAEEHETPELLASFREYLVYPRRQAIRTILERARDRAEFAPHADLELAGNMLIGAYYAQYVAGTPFPTDWAERVVDTVLRTLM
jgi:AcrR family transcriptional regulator